MGVELKKPTIIMAEPLSARELDGLFPGRVVVMDPNNPTQAATEIVAHLKQANMQQGTEKTFLALGAIAWDAYVDHRARQGTSLPRPRPKFAHGAIALGAPTLLGSYHVSQQNTQTGRLTPAMFASVVQKSQVLARAEP